MKKVFKKVLASIMAVALAAVSLTAIPTHQVKAAEKGVKIYFQNEKNWKNVYVYFWTGNGTIKGNPAWPGTKMTKVSGTKDWYEYTYKGDKAFNAVFNDNASSGTAKPQQTANHKPANLSINKGAYWFTVTSGKTNNSDGISGGVNVKVYDKAQPGFPTPQAVTTNKKTENTKTPTEKSETKEKTTAKEEKDTTPKTGDTSSPAAAIILGGISLAGIYLVSSKKKSA